MNRGIISSDFLLSTPIEEFTVLGRGKFSTIFTIPRVEPSFTNRTSPFSNMISGDSSYLCFVMNFHFMVNTFLPFKFGVERKTCPSSTYSSFSVISNQVFRTIGIGIQSVLVPMSRYLTNPLDPLSFISTSGFKPLVTTSLMSEVVSPSTINLPNRLLNQESNRVVFLSKNATICSCSWRRATHLNVFHLWIRQVLQSGEVLSLFNTEC